MRFQCPHCERSLSSKQRLTSHMANACKNCPSSKKFATLATSKFEDDPEVQALRKQVEKARIVAALRQELVALTSPVGSPIDDFDYEANQRYWDEMEAREEEVRRREMTARLQEQERYEAEQLAEREARIRKMKGEEEKSA